MTIRQLRDWLFQNSKHDQWWLSLDSVTEELPVTLSEIEEILSSGHYASILVLHVSQIELNNPPWIQIELPAASRPTKLPLTSNMSRHVPEKIRCTCPKCGGHNVQSAPMLYESGTSTFSDQTTAIGFSGIGTDHMSPMMGRGVRSGTTTTLLSAKYAPPSPELLKPAAMLTIISVILTAPPIVTMALTPEELGLFAFWILLLIISIFYLLYCRNENKKARAFNERHFPLILTNWQNSWLCHRCGYFGRL